MNKYFLLLKDWKFVYKIISFNILLLLLSFGFIWGCFIDYWYISPITSKIANPRLYNFNVIASFWSVHTNLLITLWFLYALIYHNREQKNKFTNHTSQTNITLYITITFLLFWGIIVTNILGNSEYDFKTRTTSDVIITSLTHSLTPLLMIVYYFLNCGNKIINYKSYFTKGIFIMLIFPVTYCIFTIIRAKIVNADGIKSFIFPYSFLDFYTPLFGSSLALSNFICIFILMFLLIGINLGYIAFNNWKYQWICKNQQKILNQN